MFQKVVAITLITSTVVVILLEVVLGGYIMVSSLIPFSFRYLFSGNFSNLLSIFIYVSIVFLNFIAIGVLFLGLLSGYFEKWFSYEVFGFVSLSIIVYMWAQTYQTGRDIFNDVVIKEAYVEHMRSSNPRKSCDFRSNCFEFANFHRGKKCCGWDRPQDYFQSDWNVENSDKYYLPKYCCNFWYIKFRGNNCTINTEERFTGGCRSALIDEYQIFNPISYRYGLFYPIIKAVSIVSFKMCKMSSMLPRNEGIFSNSIPK